MFLQCHIILYLITTLTLAEFIQLTIDTNGPSTEFPHFWRSTGLCPPDPKESVWESLLSDDEKQHFALIGSLPNHGIKQVRIHWLLNLISVNNDGNSLNFTHLDSLLDYLHKYDLVPGFELMGLPRGTVKSDHLKSEHYWTNLTHQIASRYINRHGFTSVAEWRFETWNEPDLRSYNTLNFTLPEYLQYVRGCARGLNQAENTTTTLKFGGPAGLFRDKTHHPLCWGVLEACTKSLCPLHYISFHRKGNATAQGVLNATLELLDDIKQHLPQIEHIPIANDEADILKTWSEPFEWRADVRYPSMILEVISDYYKSVQLNRKLKIEVLSNDNAFLNYHPFYFEQRTLFARFQMNNTNPPHNQFIKKPVYNVMALLSLLGDEYLTNTIYINHLTVIPTRSRKYHSTVTVLLSYANNTQIKQQTETHLNVTLKNFLENCKPPHQHSGKFLIYSLDNTRTNPYRLWNGAFHRNVFPTKHMRQQLRALEEPVYVQRPTSVHTDVNISLTPTIPSIFLINLCCKSMYRPSRVTHLDIFNVTYNEILITWKHDSRKNRCIKTFVVEQLKMCSKRNVYRRINNVDSIFLSFHHAPKDRPECENTRGTYRVYAVDYWGRRGRTSSPITYP